MLWPALGRMSVSSLEHQLFSSSDPAPDPRASYLHGKRSAGSVLLFVGTGRWGLGAGCLHII